MNGTNSNGWLARQLGGVLEKYGLATLFAIVFAGVVLWGYVTGIKSIETKQDITLSKQNDLMLQVLASRDDAKVLNALLTRVVIVLESIDRRQCLRDARDARERDACVAAPPR